MYNKKSGMNEWDVDDWIDSGCIMYDKIDK